GLGRALRAVSRRRSHPPPAALPARHGRQAMSEVASLLQELIRLDTTNPPGNETRAAELLRDYLEESGVECELYAKVPERANSIRSSRRCSRPCFPSRSRRR